MTKRVHMYTVFLLSIDTWTCSDTTCSHVFCVFRYRVFRYLVSRLSYRQQLAESDYKAGVMGSSYPSKQGAPPKQSSQLSRHTSSTPSKQSHPRHSSSSLPKQRSLTPKQHIALKQPRPNLHKHKPSVPNKQTSHLPSPADRKIKKRVLAKSTNPGQAGNVTKQTKKSVACVQWCY